MTAISPFDGTSPKQSPPVIRLQIDRITIDPDRFSPRADKLDPDHVKALALRAQQRGLLDPVTLWQRAQGETIFLVDGHHRLAAYAALGFPKTNARVWQGPLSRAYRLMGVENSKARRALSYVEKADFAWRLVKENGAARMRIEAGEARPDDADLADMSRPAIAHFSGISSATVGNMRKLLGQRVEAGEKVEDLSASWAAMLKLDRPTLTEEERDAANDAVREALVGQLGPIIWPHLQHRPHVVAEALQETLGRSDIRVLEWLMEGVRGRAEGEAERDF